MTPAQHLQRRIDEVETKLTICLSGRKADLLIINARLAERIAELNAKIRELQINNDYLIRTVSQLSVQVAKLMETVQSLHDTIYTKKT